MTACRIGRSDTCFVLALDGLGFGVSGFGVGA